MLFRKFMKMSPLLILALMNLHAVMAHAGEGKEGGTSGGGGAKMRNQIMAATQSVRRTLSTLSEDGGDSLAIPKKKSNAGLTIPEFFKANKEALIDEMDNFNFVFTNKVLQAVDGEVCASTDYTKSAPVNFNIKCLEEYAVRDLRHIVLHEAVHHLGEKNEEFVDLFVNTYMGYSLPSSYECGLFVGLTLTFRAMQEIPPVTEADPRSIKAALAQEWMIRSFQGLQFMEIIYKSTAMMRVKGYLIKSAALEDLAAKLNSAADTISAAVDEGRGRGVDGDIAFWTLQNRKMTEALSVAKGLLTNTATNVCLKGQLN